MRKNHHSQAPTQVIVFENHQLTPEQMGLLLVGDEHLKVKDKVKVAEGIKKVYVQSIERVRGKMKEMQSVKLLIHSIYRLEAKLYKVR